jgi:hypothetical protein
MEGEAEAVLMDWEDMDMVVVERGSEIKHEVKRNSAETLH